MCYSSVEEEASCRRKKNYFGLHFLFPFPIYRALNRQNLSQDNFLELKFFTNTEEEINIKTEEG